MMYSINELALIKSVYERRIDFNYKDIKFKFNEDTFNSELELCKWLDKHTTGLWGVEFLKIGFELKADAIIFKLGTQ